LVEEQEVWLLTVT